MSYETQSVIQFLLPLSKNVEESHLVQVAAFVHNKQLVMLAAVLASHLLHWVLALSAHTLSSFNIIFTLNFILNIKSIKK